VVPVGFGFMTLVYSFHHCLSAGSSVDEPGMPKTGIIKRVGTKQTI
jgi:hypothetical protein